MPFCFNSIAAVVAIGAIPGSLLAASDGPISPIAVPQHRIESVVRVDPATGRLVRARIVLPLKNADVPAPQPNSASMQDLIAEAAKSYELSPELVDSVIQVESNYNPLAVSPKGAQGLMQLMPATARRFGVKDTFDPKENIQGGVRYLRFLQDTFKDDRLAIAAYNAGEGAVAKYKDVPPYKETKTYVEKVGRKYTQSKKAHKPVEVAAVAEDPKPEEPQYRHVAQFVDAQGRIHLNTE